MQITHISEPNGALSKKQKLKSRKNGFANGASDKKNAPLAVNQGRFI